MSQRAVQFDAGEDWFGGQGVPGYSAGGGDMNPAGAAQDPFAYTNGSLLTPWTEDFKWSGGTAGAYTPPEFKAFDAGRFNYNAPRVDRIAAMQLSERPDFQFQFNQAEDPGAQVREKRGMQALQNSAAARGNLLTGATAKALQDYGQESASQEYQASYQRALQNYNTNLGKEFGTFDRNWGAQFGAGQANQNAAIAEGQMGLEANKFNYGIARQGYEDERSAANAAASASAGNSAASYNQALREYGMRQDNFRTNQDRQYSMLMGMAGMGQAGAGALGNYGSQYGANAGSIYGQQGNAQAAGQVGAGNAWSGALSSIGNSAMNYGMWKATQPRSAGAEWLS